ncbi:MAG TPA: DNA internalization-related competence protein ComEC/Rec2, partial [Gemmatimonadales bacterium]|nr:DNA internalization-related competence protein ComEC/Rec2 [Gemmatimonadales bacterium]
MRPPLMWIAIGFGAGLWAGLRSFGDGGGGAWEVGAPVLVGALLVARRTPVAAAMGVAAIAGLLWGGAAVGRREATCAGIWGRGTRDGGRVAHGAIVRLLDRASDDGGIVEAEVRGGPCRGALTLRWPGGKAAAGGTTWLVAGPYVGDAARGLLRVRSTRLLDGTRRGRGGLRDRIAGRSAALFGARAPLVDALVIGRTADVDSELRERYARSGLAHILSISGLHVGFFAAWLALLLRLAGVPPRPRLVCEGVAVFAYCWVIGFPAPATRAGLMLALDGVARWRQRVVAPRGTVALAALVVLLADPWAIRSVGAWLSVSAIAAVIWAGRAVSGPPPLKLVAPAAAATLVTAPITAYAFGTVAPIGVIANLVAIPLGSIAVPGMIFALGLSSLVPALGALLAAGSGATLALLDLVAATAARVPGGHVISMPGWPAAIAWTGVLAVAWWLWTSPRRHWVVAGRVALIAAALAWGSFLARAPRDSDGVLTVHFLDVGQGDAAALRTPAGHWVLIDGGPRTPQGDAGRRVVLPFLRRLGAGALALVVATHGDADHLGGLPAVVEALPPRVVLEPGEPLGRPLYLEFLADVERAGATWHPARTGDRVELDGVTFQVLSPDSGWAAQQEDVNEQSVVLLVTYGATRLLFMGDAGVPVEARLARQVGRVDLLKVGHHGSRTATSEEWLSELAPAEAVISVGAHNTYGHPAPEVLARLLQHHVTTLRTDQLGTITFTTDGHRALID